MTPAHKPTSDEIARTRKLWAANKPGETGAPAYVPDPPALWLVGIALVVASIAQSALAPTLAFRGATPSLVTLVVIWYGVRTNTVQGLACGLIAGACEDALTGLSGFAWTFATGFAGAVAGRLAHESFADSKFVLVPFVFGATLLRYLLFTVLMQAQGHATALPLAHLHAALWQSALDAVLALLVLQFVPSVRGAGAYRR